VYGNQNAMYLRGPQNKIKRAKIGPNEVILAFLSWENITEQYLLEQYLKNLLADTLQFFFTHN
jgi:hypothetical protein